MQIITRGTNTKNIIGQRYEVISTSSQTPYGKTLKYGSSSLEIQVSITSTPNAEWSGHLNQNIIPLLKCLTLLNTFFYNSPEALQEASEALEKVSDYYQDYVPDIKQSTLPQALKVIQGRILSSKIRPPLDIDLD
ncbi:hypothetical protein VB711_11430 [Cronbergia sp. UHCC 0137]|uniref:hypothetical protein n=1 Tax=Cronbergia sp. UHCC 0137 TaxID=3110239 RepID=UPI002B201AB8|nr:hypothetical protein [Cronbergia sp. UHCC 0137]MEA5618445.1 hypothetical protein [Cronbergia sp. UHCC 0137]